MSAVFVETSSLLAVVFREARAPEALERLERATRLVASRVIRVEAERALYRLALDRPEAEPFIAAMRRELNLFWPKVDFLDVTRPICDAATRIAPRSRLRTLDAIHLATFFRLREMVPRLEMLTFDPRILDALGGD